MTESKTRDYSETLFLPKTDFPMRAGLPQKEPEILARWQKLSLYARLRAAAEGRMRAERQVATARGGKVGEARAPSQS